VIRLEDGGPPVGLFPWAKYQQNAVTLRPGCSVLIFTDGVTEAVNADGEEFRRKSGLLELLRSDSADPQLLVTNILGRVREWSAGVEQHDDVTLLGIRIV